MNPNASPSHSRASEIWKRLAGMFGGESVERKFGVTPPPEWVVMLSRLKDFEIDRGLRRLAYGGSRGVPSLPEFTKLCRAVGGDEFEDGQPGVPRLPSGPDSWDDKPWEKVGNRYLLGYLAKTLQENPQRYGTRASAAAMRMNDDELRRAGLHRKQLDASPEFIANLDALVRAKNAWVEDMKDLAANGRGEVDPKLQKAIWVDYMARAELEILKRREAAQAA